MKPDPSASHRDVGAALQWARQLLVNANLADEYPAAHYLLTRAIAQPIAFLLAHPEFPIPTENAHQFEAWMHRLVAGEPLPYITGEAEFFGLTLEVSPDTLIPRPETELLVERAIAFIGKRAARVADAGTGSGCVAIAIASQCPQAQIVATDTSRGALDVADRNVRRHGLSERVTLLQTDLLAAVPGPLDLICANLPYIPTDTLRPLPVARFEPWSALDGGADGLRVIERLLQQATSRMASHGAILLEIESTLGAAAIALAKKYFPMACIDLHQDYAGLDRLVEIILQS